jgi:hypothetical protein
MIGGDTGRLDPASYARWNTAARAIESIPVPEAAQVYVNVKPLFDRAYRELGYPDGDFDEALVRAIRLLQATPEVTAEPALLRRETYFEHDDDALRGLPPVQKQLILMGPDNRRIVLVWIGRLAAELDLAIAK